MALSGLDIYKLLPKTNCRECGFVTCLAFAMQLAKKTVSIDKCPYLSAEARAALEASSQPPIKLVTIGNGETRLELGNETVLFRHEEKFHHPCGIGFIIEDKLAPDQIKARVQEINALKFERVGQKIEVNLIAVKQTANMPNFLKAVSLVMSLTDLNLVLIASQITALQEAASICKQKRPLIFSFGINDAAALGKLAKEFDLPLVASAPSLEALSSLTRELNSFGAGELILDTGTKPIRDKIWDLTQIRRLALKKSNRSLGYPVLTLIEPSGPYEEAMEAATYIAKYAGIILLNNTASWEALSLLTLRQNIYTDPQKPLQIEPKLYCVGETDKKSPVLVTTNFSLTYYTVLGEVEASKVPAYILSVDTEGMSVLTAWAAEKFTPQKINESIDKFAVKEAVSHKKIIIPGYVAVMSGELEETSGLSVIVGPKEAATLPAFLKNL